MTPLPRQTTTNLATTSTPTKTDNAVDQKPLLPDPDQDRVLAAETAIAVIAVDTIAVDLPHPLHPVHPHHHPPTVTTTTDAIIAEDTQDPDLQTDDGVIATTITMTTMTIDHHIEKGTDIDLEAETKLNACE